MISNNDINEKSNKDKRISLELGDIIQINDPLNERLNNNIFLIEYIDNSKIKLINSENGDSISLTRDENGILGNGTIEEIILLSKSEQQGYARQNNLVTGTFIDIHFGGDLPLILTGEITNLENDMIEIKTIDNDIIYINFDYKGIPDDLPIEFIDIREKPVLSDKNKIYIEEVTNDIKKITPDPIDNEFVNEDDINEFSNDNDESDMVEFKIPVKNVKDQLREFIIKGNQIKFLNEELGPVVRYENVSSQKERYNIETQTNDLLDDLLSNIPDSQRTHKVMNNLHTIIERFIQLRRQFSKFDEYGNVESKLIFEANYKPLIKYFEEFKQNLYWILPVVNNIKKVYDVQNDEEDEQEDYINLNLNRDLRNIMELIEEYKSNNAPIDQNKYIQLYQNLNKYFTPFIDVNDEKQHNFIQKKVNTNITCIINNLDNMLSSVFSKDKIRDRRFLISKYNLNLTALEKVQNEKDTNVRININPPDLMSISSFITLPEPTIKFSKINLPNTNLIDKAHLNSVFLNYWEFLKGNTRLKNIFIEDENQNILFNENNFVNNIKNYIFNINLNSSSTTSQADLYKKFLEILIPKTRVIFNLMKKYITGKLSIVDVVSYLEPFLIYTDNLTYKQFEEITTFIDREITLFNQKLIVRSKEFFSLKNLRSSPLLETNAFSLIYNIKNENQRKELFESYNVNISNLEFKTNSEVLKQLIVTDNNKYYSSYLSEQNIPLMIPNELDKLFTEEEKLLNKQNDNNSCNSFTIAKSYEDDTELFNDNDIIIYYDKRFDKTDYSLLKDYESQLLNMTPESFSIFFEKELHEKLKLSINEANLLVKTLLSGHKEVLDGDYAYIISKDDRTKVAYYIRKNNKWILDKKVSDDLFNIDENFSCNFNINCIENDNENCESLNTNRLQLNKSFISNINKEFDKNYFKSQENLKQIIAKELSYSKNRIDSIRKIDYNFLLKYNNLQYELGINTDDEGNTMISPNSKCLFLILSQGDFIKVQTDIIKFVNLKTRTPIIDGLGPLNKTESEFWLYCIESNLPLLPLFKYTLASEFITNYNNYHNKLQLLISEIGKLSDDGNYWIDENSGWTIKKIEDDIDEGYEDGFKRSSRSLLEDDAGNNVSLAKASSFISAESQIINNIVNTISIAMGINIENQKEFIINCVSDALKNTVESEEDYKIKVKEMANRNKKIMSYVDLLNTSILLYTLGMILIAIQTAVPSVRTRKTYPGCIKSFNGFPFQGTGDLSSLEYLTCIVIDIKHSGEPWYVLKGKKSATILNKLQITIENVLLNLVDVKNKMILKTEYLLLHKDEDIPDEYSIQKWSQFLPPLIKFKIKNLNSISTEFKNKLLNELKSGSKNQFLKIQVIIGKIMKYSLGVQENIDNIVKKVDLLMLNQNQEPFLENSCCFSNDKSTTLQYFTKKSPDIEAYNKEVIYLSNYLNDIKFYSYAKMLQSVVNTKIFYPIVSEKISEKIIYLSFIHYCKFKSLLPIPEYLLPLCSNKPQDLVISDKLNIEEIISKLKNDGRNYNSESLIRLIQLISRKNIIYLDSNNSLISSITKFSGILQMLQDNYDETIEPVLITLFLNNINTFEVGSEIISNDTKKLNNYLVKSNESLRNELNEFLTKNQSILVSNLLIKKVIDCVKNFSNWKLNDCDNTDYLPPDKLYNIINFNKNYIEKFLSVFPNIILNNISYNNTKIPEYLGISDFHKKKISDLIKDYYLKLGIFYKKDEIIKILNSIQEIGKNLISLSNFTPIFTTLTNEKYTINPIMNERAGMLIYEYYFLKSLNLFINLTDDKNMIVFELEKKNEELDLFSEEFLTDVNTKDEVIDESYQQSLLINGNQKKTKEIIASLLTIFLEIYCDHKKIINLSYQDIENNIFKLKEREKEIITDRLAFIDDEEREADTILKINKLGIWNKGLQKGLTKYSRDNYDDDREFRNEMNIIENKIKNNNSDLNDNNLDILIDDFLEENESNSIIEYDEYNMNDLRYNNYNDFEEEE